MESIIESLIDTGLWGENDVKIGIRAGFKCEYCDKDLLASVDNYKEWQKDHIIPKFKEGENTDRIENIALSCRTCNVSIKNRWNPAEVTGNNASRQELIAAVREYVRKRRTEILIDICSFREIVYSE